MSVLFNRKANEISDRVLKKRNSMKAAIVSGRFMDLLNFDANLSFSIYVANWLNFKVTS
jgi:hypothetical protein